MRNERAVAGFALVAMTFLSLYANAVALVTASQSVLNRCESEDDVAIRLWYLPSDSNSTQGPLILLPTSSQDPRLDTRPAWILYVSLGEIHNVVRVLAQSNLRWKESSIPRKLVVDPLQLPHLGPHTMEIAVSYPTGSAIAEVTGDRVQPLIFKAYCALSSPKARESMAVWTGPMDCGRVVQH
jgi:hypothetical protein